MKEELSRERRWESTHQLMLRLVSEVLFFKCRQSHSAPLSDIACFDKWSSRNVVFTYTERQADEVREE